MRDSIVFYRSFYEAIKEIPLEEQGVVYNAIYGYALDGIEPELVGIAKAIFLLVKPQIDANNSKYANGCKGAEHGKKGGRPQKQNPKETPKEPLRGFELVQEENPKETPNENENDNVNENDLKKEVVEEKKPATAGWVSCYENNIGIITPIVAEEVNSYELADEVVEEAIKEAVKSDVRKPKYICAILKDFAEHNIKTKADVDARRIERERGKLHNKDKPTNAYYNPSQSEFNDLDKFYTN